MTNALLTDLYELNMAATYLRRGMNRPATFSLFVRHLPSARGFLVAAGLESCLGFLEGFRFEPDELDHLRNGLGFDHETVEALARVRFTGDVWAVPEGRILFAAEPLLEVTAPLAEAQLVETALLNMVTFQTTVASKAARCVVAAGGRDVVDFSFRRTQGIDAGLAVARSSALVGFVATSNVEAARRYGLRTSGTMAHSFIQAFPTEAEAFRAFAEDHPGRTTFLVDTYDTDEGVRTAVQVIRELGLEGSDGLAVRLDSGEVGELAARARRILDAAGLPNVRVFVSGGLDEYAIEDLVTVGAPIDGFGVGTKMGVSADAPYLDSVYKLVEYDGRPVTKLSTGKVTAPGRKQVFRPPGMTGDVLGLRTESPPEGTMSLLEPVMSGGRRGGAGGASLDAATARFRADLAEMPPRALSLRTPAVPPVTPSRGLRELTDRVTTEARSQG